jgi:hypothetical protein
VTAPVPPPRRVVRRLLVALVAAGVVAGAALPGAAAPAAAATSPCVAVVVDGRLAGGPLRTACAKGDPDSGLEALTRAGFGYAFQPRNPGLVCAIDGLPECSRTSTETYWSYWYRARGSTRWVYSTQGAGSHDPEPGSTEAWVWQEGGRRPPPAIGFRTVCPQAAGGGTRPASATPTPARTAEPVDPPATGSPRPAGGGGAGGSGGSHGAAASAPPTGPVTSSPPASRPPTSAAPSTATAATPSPAESGSVAAPRPDDGDDGPPWAGLAVGGALVLGLAAAALARARRGGSP